MSFLSCVVLPFVDCLFAYVLLKMRFIVLYDLLCDCVILTGFDVDDFLNILVYWRKINAS